MKTKAYKILAIVMTFAMMLSLAACDFSSFWDFSAFGNRDASAYDDGKGEMTLVVIGDTEKEYTVDLDNVEITKGLVSVFDYLKEKEGLTYEIDGTYINDVNGLTEGAPEGAYLSLYTSVEKDFDVSRYATTVEYNGRSATTSGYGALEMHIEGGALILIKLEIWEG